MRPHGSAILQGSRNRGAEGVVDPPIFLKEGQMCLLPPPPPQYFVSVQYSNIAELKCHLPLPIF